MKIFLAAILFLITLPVITYAHSIGGTLEKTEGDYFIDIGHSEQNLAAGVSSRFDFQLLRSADKSEVKFTEVWVRILKDGKIFFVGSLPQPDFGVAGMTYAFPEAGEYDFTAIYKNGKDDIVEAAFMVPVAGQSDSGGSIKLLQVPIVVFFLGIVTGFIVKSIMGKMKP